MCVSRQGRLILDAVTLVLAAPVTVVTGPSGAGKTTLLRLLNGLDAPDAGAVRFDDVALSEWVPRALRRAVGFVAQQPSAIADTGGEELDLAARFGGSSVSLDQARALCGELDIEDDHLARDPRALSVGERQRLAIVRALVAAPKALVLDEPTSAQDDLRAEKVHRLLHRYVQDGLRVVVVEHKLDALHVYQAEDITTVRMAGGRISA